MTSRTPGRPRLASKQLLQEAAFELFQLRGYRQTSVELIAKTAGFSRATFFNFFGSKTELFWVETDALIVRLGEHLETAMREAQLPTLASAVTEFAGGLTSSDIPWALQNTRLLEAADDLVASGAGRVLELNRLFLRYLRHSAGPEAGDRDSLALAGEAAAITGQVLVALTDWIDAGVRRGSLRDHLARTLYT